MLHNLRTRAQDESGFTLIELLVVILIIGILAAIALPTFLGQRTKAQDSSAKADARNVVSEMESCFTDNETYAGCPAASYTRPSTISATGGSITPNGTVGYTVVAASPSGNTFTVVRANGTYTRTCTVDDANDRGGCPGTGTSGSW